MMDIYLTDDGMLYSDFLDSTSGNENRIMINRDTVVLEQV